MKKRNEAIVKIACCQMEPIVGEKDRNIRRSSEMIEEADGDAAPKRGCADAWSASR